MTRKKTKYIHEGLYVAEVEVEVITTEDAWSPYLSVEDASRLDEVREALKQKNFGKASEYGRIYKLKPIDD
ncbi:MAG: hypothetical protein U5K31_01650 [Balneolaceae bacterium]|nr:hypothetical protein [Balneolaceae bacterium]